jgi:hypothetical protein
MKVPIAALVVFALASCKQQPQRIAVMTLCDLSRDFTAYRGRVVAVRGVYFYGLRQSCPQTCATGPWPSFVDLVWSDAAHEATWGDLADAERTAEREAKQSRRVEVWVTVKALSMPATAILLLDHVIA